MLTWKKAYILGAVIHQAFNEKKERVGYLCLEQVGAHTHWCWWQEDGFYMSPGCLDCVREKQKELFRDRRTFKAVYISEDKIIEPKPFMKTALYDLKFDGKHILGNKQ